MISYREANKEDIEGIMTVITDVNLHAQNESKEKITERISEDQLLCVLFDNKIIGFLGWSIKYQNNPKYWYLEQVTIQKDYRGKGIGQDFMKYFLQFCSGQNVKKIFTHVQIDNIKSINMFNKTGWSVNVDSEMQIQDEITYEYNLT